MKLKWRDIGGYGVGFAPPIRVWLATLGVDATGKTWLCRVSPDMHSGYTKYLVEFDFNGCMDNDDDDTPFLRDRVVYAEEYYEEEYWNARIKTYNTKIVFYKQIDSVIQQFCISHGIRLERF